MAVFFSSVVVGVKLAGRAAGDFVLVPQGYGLDSSCVMKVIISLISLLGLSLLSLAGDVPRGFMEMDELAEAQAKAEESGKLLAIVAQGFNDN